MKTKASLLAMLSLFIFSCQPDFFNEVNSESNENIQSINEGTSLVCTPILKLEIKSRLKDSKSENSVMEFSYAAKGCNPEDIFYFNVQIIDKSNNTLFIEGPLNFQNINFANDHTMSGSGQHKITLGKVGGEYLVKVTLVEINSNTILESREQIISDFK